MTIRWQDLLPSRLICTTGRALSMSLIEPGANHGRAQLRDLTLLIPRTNPVPSMSLEYSTLLDRASTDILTKIPLTPRTPRARLRIPWVRRQLSMMNHMWAIHCIDRRHPVV